MKLSIAKRATLCAAVFAASMVAATSAQAACTQSSQIVERVLTYRSTIAGGVSYIYFRPRTALTNSSYYYCRVLRTEPTGDKMISEAAAAKASRVEVNAQGSAASCPSAGTGRYMGDCNYIYMLN